MGERIVPADLHNQVVKAAYVHRGFTAAEAEQAARFCELAAHHGIKTHNALKALHLDELFGSGNKKSRGCVPGATIRKIDSRFAASQKWDAQRKLGQAVAFEAIDTAIELADKYGVGVVSVDNAFHYLWGGGYVMHAAKKGYIAYTNCTSSLAEVVPFGGKTPTLGTNPHSWGLPTTEACGFPIVIDWATSTVAMGRVQALLREGKELPPQAAVDKDGKETRDPSKVAALLPFGMHKGYGLSLLNEVYAAFIGGSLPTIRSRPDQAPEGEKIGCNFFFQVIHPEALNCGSFAKGRTQDENIKAVLDDILGHGNDTGSVMLPGEIEHKSAKRSERNGGLIFTDAEVAELAHVAEEAGVAFNATALKVAGD